MKKMIKKIKRIADSCLDCGNLFYADIPTDLYCKTCEAAKAYEEKVEDMEELNSLMEKY